MVEIIDDKSFLEALTTIFGSVLFGEDFSLFQSDIYNIVAQSGLDQVNVTDTIDNDNRTDRSARVTNDEHKTVITDFTDSVNNQVDVSSLKNITSVHEATDPFTDSGLVAVLSRVYPIKRGTWSYSSTSGALLQTIQFPTDLFNPTILDRLVHYRYFRSAVEVSIRLNTTVFHSGMLLVSWLPHWNGTSNSDFDPFDNMYGAANNNVMTVSANTQDTITFLIPYVAPSAYMDLKTSNEIKGFNGHVNIYVLLPLLSGSTAEPAIEYTVYARFVEPQVAAPFHAQMMQKAPNSAVDREAQKRSADGSVAQVLGATTKSLFNIGSKVLGKTVDKFVDNVANMLPSLPLLLNQPNNLETTKKVAVVSGSNFSLVKGLDNSHVIGLDQENRVAKDYTMFLSARDYDLFSEYKRLPGLIDTWSFSTADATLKIVKKYPVSPLLCQNKVVNVTNFVFQPTHISNLASLFGGWRGDLQFMFQFVCSRFISARVRIEWIPTPEFVDTTVTLELEGNNINKVVDINGDTVCCFTVPYLHYRHWLEVSDYYKVNVGHTGMDVSCNGMLRISIVNIISSGTAEANEIRVATWISGGESFQTAFPAALNSSFSEVHYSNPIPEGLEEITAQMETNLAYLDIRKVFQDNFQPLIPGRITTIEGLEIGEGVSAFSELCRRYEYSETVTISNATNFASIPFARSNLSPRRFYRILKTFLYTRGSMRFKIVPNFAPAISDIIVASSSAFNFGITSRFGEQGLIYHNLGYNPVLEVTIPYFYSFPFYSHDTFVEEIITQPFLAVGQHITNTPKGYLVYWAVGDDYKFGWPCSPAGLMTIAII